MNKTTNKHHYKPTFVSLHWRQADKLLNSLGCNGSLAAKRRDMMAHMEPSNNNHLLALYAKQVPEGRSEEHTARSLMPQPM